MFEKRQATKHVLAEEINKLPIKERIILSLFYCDELNLHEISVVMRLTKMQATDLFARALKKLGRSLPKSEPELPCM